MPRPLVGEQAGLEDYTVIQYLFIYSPCRVWGWGDGVSHPASLPYALGGPKTPQLWFFPVETPIPRHCWAQSSPKCLRPAHLPACFSQASFGRLSDQTDRSQKHKGSHPSPHRAAPRLHRAGFSVVQPLPRCMCWVRKRMLVPGLQLQLFCVCFLPRKLPARERGRNTYLTRLYKTSIITQEPVWEFFFR